MSKKCKVWLIVAAVLVLAGIGLFAGVMTMLDWDFKKLSRDKFETNEYILEQSYEKISVDTQAVDVVLMPVEGTQTRVTCYEKAGRKHTVQVEGDTLIIRTGEEKKWRDYIGFHFGTAKITVSLPKGTYEALTVNNTTGDVEIASGLELGSADISVTTGDILLRNVNCTGAMKLSVSTGDICMTDLRCGTLSATGTTGETVLANVLVSGKMEVTRTTGDIALKACDAEELYLKTTTGDVEGTLLTPKTFSCKTTTGDVEVPLSSQGGLCQVKTTTGDIELELCP